MEQVVAEDEAEAEPPQRDCSRRLGGLKSIRDRRSLMALSTPWRGLHRTLMSRSVLFPVLPRLPRVFGVMCFLGRTITCLLCPLYRVVT